MGCTTITMAKDDLYIEFLNKLKADKKPEEIADFLSGVMKFGSAQLYAAMFYFLELEDLQALDAIADEKKREEELQIRFKNRTGVTTSEFMNNLRDTIAKNYLFPELKSRQNTTTPTSQSVSNK